MSRKPIRVGIVGVGRVGRDVARILAARQPAFTLVGGCSRDPAHLGQDLGVLSGGPAVGAPVSGSLSALLDQRPEVTLIATTSFLAEVAADIRDCVAAGSNVLVTAEEAAYPWAVDEALADELGQLARERGVTILGGGVNPGLIFDALVLTAAGACPEVAGIAVERHVTFARFSANVLSRLGVGYSADEFATGVREQRVFGHLGFPQSMRVVAGALGRRIDRIDRHIEPIFADAETSAENLTVPAGHTAGVEQHYIAVSEGRPWYDARLIGHIDPGSAGLGARDVIRISGAQDVNLVVDPGFDPQVSSAAVLANSIERLVEASPGWKTVAELPPAHP